MLAAVWKLTALGRVPCKEPQGAFFLAFSSFPLAKEEAIFGKWVLCRGRRCQAPLAQLPFLSDGLPFCGHAAAAEGCATELKAVLFHGGVGSSLQLANNELSVQPAL